MISEGWISIQEMEFVEKQMTKETGSILEVGSANGRLFSYLVNKKPKWKYHAVDPWEQEQVRLQVDWDKDYFEPGNLKEVITKQMFQTHCPFAITYEMYFDDFETDHKFDIISMGLISNRVDWEQSYKKALTFVKDNGIIIGRNLTHKKYGSIIKKAISNYYLGETCKGSFILKKHV